MKKLALFAAAGLLLMACANRQTHAGGTKYPLDVSPPVPDTPAGNVGKAIDAIIYSANSPEEALSALRPYAALMETKGEIAGRSSIAFGICITGGPGVEECSVMHSGLMLVFDPESRLRVVRRAARLISGVAYPPISLSEPGFQYNGYARWYPN